MVLPSRSSWSVGNVLNLLSTDETRVAKGKAQGATEAFVWRTSSLWDFMSCHQEKSDVSVQTIQMWVGSSGEV